MPGDSAIFNFDFIDPFGLPGIQYSVHAKSGGANEEYVIPMSHVDFPPYYINTYEGSWVFEEPGAAISYYGRAEADTFVMTQSYKNGGNQFPPDGSLYAELAPDPEGDAQGDPDGIWLDLTGSGITYSDTRIFAKLEHAGGGWPTNQGTNFYFYAFGILPPDTMTTNITAMVYCNIPFIFPAGLYTLNIADTSFQRIADIDVSVSADLHLSCAISDLLQAPGWSTWPPEAGFVITSGVTFTVALTTPTFNDFSYPSAFVPQSQVLQTLDNSPPEIAGELDIAPEEYIFAYLSYSDPDNNLPTEKSLIFDDVPYEMGTYSRDYTDNALFEYELEWPGGGWHTYYFRFSDGAETVQTELDSVYTSPIGVDDGNIPNQFMLSQNYPNPFNAQTTIAFRLDKPSHVNLAVYDITGSMVKVLKDSYMAPGVYSVVWNGRNDSGEEVSSGVYFFGIDTGYGSDTKRMILLK